MLKNILIVTLLLLSTGCAYSQSHKNKIIFTYNPTIKEIVEQYAEAYGTEFSHSSTTVYDTNEQNHLITYLKDGSTITVIRKSNKRIALFDYYNNEKLILKRNKK
jgi:hypothetical protein